MKQKIAVVAAVLATLGLPYVGAVLKWGSPDKIPGFDVVWNALHTVVRVPIAALVAYHASSQLTPQMQILATALGAAVALAAHGSKTALRTAVTPSPEPVSNIALSTTEDAAAIGLTWVATHHPYTGGAIAAACVLLLIFSVRWIVLRLRRLWERRPAWLRANPNEPTVV